MPWFPDFVAAAELARQQTRVAGRADPVAAYLGALTEGDSRALETAWPGEVVVYDPRAGEVRGHRQLRRFVRRSQDLLAERHASAERVASTCVGGRAVVEVLAHLDHDSAEMLWPLAVVAESPDERSVVFRIYGSLWPVDGHRHVRAPLLPPAPPARPGGVVGRYLAALDAGETDAIVSTFAPGGYLREPLGATVHRGAAALRSYFSSCFSGGGIGLENCTVTDDGARCAVEYNCVRWGGSQLPAQAGIVVFERGADGLLDATRVYDDVEAPSDSQATR
jgi:hypothetical protein